MCILEDSPSVSSKMFKVQMSDVMNAVNTLAMEETSSLIPENL
jgi:hypothetical protein